MTNDSTAPLHQQHCRPRSTSDVLREPELSGLLEQLDGWEREGSLIHRTFSFKNFYETIAFVNAVAWVANREDHHPELQVGYKTCRIEYTTHSAGGLTRNDMICAARIDAST